jgi:non-ribosomal peptide synthetase component F
MFPYKQINPFNELLQQVDKATQEIYQWQEYFSWDLAESELLPFGFNFDTQSVTYSTNELSFSLIQQYVCFEQFKVKLSCTQQADDLVAAFEYDANLFNQESIQLFAQYFHTILESAIAHPENSISQLPILDQHHQQKLLFEFNIIK